MLRTGAEGASRGLSCPWVDGNGIVQKVSHLFHHRRGCYKSNLDQSMRATEHLLSFEELEKKIGVQFDISKPANSAGLSQDEASKRLAEYGPNMLSPPKKIHPVIQFILYMLHLFNVMLWVSAIAAYVVYAIQPEGNSSNIYIGAVLLFVAFANAGIEFYQTQKSQAILESFMNLIPAKCYVLRNGKTELSEAVNLVYGDIVYLRSGDKVPADLVLFASTDLKVDNSSLTGEAEPQPRGPGNTHQNPLEAHNLCFNGTLCVNGDAYGIVVRTGDHTVIGQIAFLTSSEDKRESPMNQEINTFVYTIASAAAVIAIIFFIVSMVKGNTLASSLNFAIGTFVSFVPEGLPATVTILLSLAAKKMAARNVLVKDLQGVETLGAITLLATDKTGTLTRNQMTVTYVWSGATLYFAQIQAGNDPSSVMLDLSHPAPNEIMHISLLCSKARFENNEGPISSRPVLGDATEAGLLRIAAQKLENFEGMHDTYPKVFEIPFNSENKWAMTIHKKKHADGSLMLYLKGAPERVLRICSTFHNGSQVVPLTEQHKADFDKMYNFMASKGHRVLAFAALALPGDKYPENFQFSKDLNNFPNSDLTFYGLVSLEDPPKHGVREAIGHCRAAGIKVMMVTGDHPLTAEAIGRKINLMLQDTKESLAAKRKCDPSQVPESDVNAIVIHGEKIDSLTEADWDNIFSKEEIIFARTSPKHKLTIVKHAQSLGHIVGVTGDGVNDSPALKKADLGIAMNVSGSDVSKEAAAMILIDDNFASAVNGIEEGRLIFQNLKKSIRYTITHTMPQVWANLLYIAVPIPLPLSAILILITDLGFEMFMALSFAWDASENPTGLMKLPPRKPVNQESINRIRRIASEEAKGTRTYWKRFVEKFTDPADEDTLVDNDALRWAYLEGGSIETIGCLVAFFYALYAYKGITPGDAKNFGTSWPSNDPISLANGNSLNKDEQQVALSMGQGAYYIALMIQQSFNMFICKARLSPPYGSFMFSNFYNFFGVFGGGAFVFFVVFAPFMNTPFGTDWRVSPWVLLISVAFGVVNYIYAILRFLIMRASNPIKYSKDVQGLDLHPTRFSTGR